MLDRVAWFLGPLLRWLFPAPGRHRASHGALAAGVVDPPTLVLPRGKDELIPPYMQTAEERRMRERIHELGVAS